MSSGECSGSAAASRSSISRVWFQRSESVDSKYIKILQIYDTNAYVVVYYVIQMNKSHTIGLTALN